MPNRRILRSSRTFLNKYRAMFDLDAYWKRKDRLDDGTFLWIQSAARSCYIPRDDTTTAGRW